MIAPVTANTINTKFYVETNRPEQPMIFYGHEIKIQAIGYEIETTVYTGNTIAYRAIPLSTVSEH